MARQLLVRLPTIEGLDASGGDPDGIGPVACEWALAEGGALVGEVSAGSLAEAAEVASGLRVALVVPADGVLLAETRVPGGNAQRAQTAAKYALEEQLADDVEDLHFALGARQGPDLWPVAVVDRDTMAALAARTAEVGLRPLVVVPETLALPLFDPDEPPGTVWTALADGEEAVVRLGDHAGFVSDTDMVGAMLDGSRSERLAEEAAAAASPDAAAPAAGADAAGVASLQLVLHEIDGAAPIELPEGLEVERRRIGSRLELYAVALDEPPAINLLQGEFSPRTGFDRTWKPWRWTAGLAAALLLIVVAGRWLDLRTLSAQEAALDAEIAQTFERALPGVRRVRPRQQMEQALQRIGAGGGGGFTDTMSQIAAALATQPGTEVNSIGVRDDRFDLDLTVEDVPVLDALGSALAERGSLALTVQSANRDDDGVRARVRVE